METVYFTLVAVALYFVSDRLLNWLESQAGRRFENRSVVFFVILGTLALSSFALIRHFTAQ